MPASVCLDVVQVCVVAGAPGGGWCDPASRYVQTLRPVFRPKSSHLHATGIKLLNVADNAAVAIWNIDGQPGSSGGRLDMQITNTTNHALRLVVVEGSSWDQVVVRALKVEY